jgi:hypothetical protein
MRLITNSKQQYKRKLNRLMKLIKATSLTTCGTFIIVTTESSISHCSMLHYLSIYWCDWFTFISQHSCVRTQMSKKKIKIQVIIQEFPKVTRSPERTGTHLVEIMPSPQASAWLGNDYLQLALKCCHPPKLSAWPKKNRNRSAKTRNTKLHRKWSARQSRNKKHWHQ